MNRLGGERLLPGAPSLSMKRSVPLAALLAALPLFAVACHRRPVDLSAKWFTPTPAPSAIVSPPTVPEFAVDAVSTREGEASWYDVPAQSLPERRAWSGELTAASDKLDLNTYVRVRRVDAGDNGKSIVVRITDSGVHRKGTLIDLNRDAAETLGMVEKGVVRVRVETLALKHADTDKPVDKKNAAPTAAKITATPAATKEQEKNNSAAKAGGATPP